MDKRTYCKGIISLLLTLLAACSLEGDIEALRQKPVGNPGLPAPSAPATAPTVTVANGMLAVSWQAVERATTYEVWTGTTNNPNTAVKRGTDVSGLSAVITGLTNNTTYYVWIKAKNSGGASGFSPVASGTPFAFTTAPQAPATPTVIVGNGQITVTWAAVQGAMAYEVWSNTTNNSATATLCVADVFVSRSATILSLTNGTTYYFWVKALNNIGTSGFSPVVSGTPANRAGLYKGSINDSNKIGEHNLLQALAHISSNAVSGDNFYIVLGANELASPTSLDYSGKTVRITLTGYGGERTITLNSNGSMFTINTGVTLTLDENISLVGRSTNNASLVSLSSGNLVINAGAKISGNINGNISSNTGGGINVYNGTVTMNGGVISGNTADSGGGICAYGGTVTMNGGTISGNTAAFIGNGIYVGGTFTMYGGTISGNTGGEAGGGISVGSDGTLTMYGGVINGNTATYYGGGIFVASSATFKKLPSGGGQNSGIIYGSEAVGNDVNGIPLKNTANPSPSFNGHAVYFSSYRRRNTTAGQTDHIDSTTGRGFSTSGDPPYGN